MFEVLFQYGPFTLTTFNVFLVLAVLLGAFFLMRFIAFKKMSLRFVTNNLLWFILAALLGGRLFYLIEHFSAYRGNALSMLYVWDLGFSALGIFYATFVLLFVLARRDHEDFWAWADAIALTGLLSLALIHIGHFFDGSFYGKPTDLPWGMSFENFKIPYITPIHPTQLYSALAAFVVFNFCMWSSKRTHLTGVVGSMAIMLYSLCALGIDFLHGEPSSFVKINFGLIAAAAFVFYIHTTHKKLILGK